MKRILCLAVALAGCATAAPTPTTSTTNVCDYFPLAVGNQWHYDGERRPDGTREPIDIAVTGMKDGYYQQSSGAAVACDVEGVRDPQRVLIQPPLQVGHKWKAVPSVTTVEEYEIVDVGSTVNVPAGSFSNTITVRSKLTDRDRQGFLTAEFTYAPGVGLLRVATSHTKGTETTPQIELVLRSFTVAPAKANPSS
ncbi:MAG: hypothetical protein JST54_22575 [Deltaproteobacteria bacterium]|nr:hypothetical protein [Deltaproteobacteria bacterium]